ncbi:MULTISPECIES: transporter substrate-binding domain-containing protein [unclassified Rhodococcus (in: high G+C Gram-positive bacteria)]|uniref:transporter substrate-binding domain-containing protein n=1 Tax=unclassified Rhodococcus (in: high G+C Gram-positive bacteria) TaxID=192944 RepID=UPI0011F040D9|nr:MULTISPECIES: transporter substrate-binding domain-containing protein [unclassified Rhodococcus (in: high G+C Gram-positive bacteria)]KAA0925012.1 transporter substrate-binding domain-containing protein [Rhodococcus sp. ANT_H53B]MDI9927829.1 transporter substrate-binding domain-containing protein [Rhodococcus sp. IEGM 1341]
MFSSRVLISSVAALCTLALGACGAPAAEEDSQGSGGLPGEVSAAGKIVVALNPTLKPISWVESNNELQGLVPDLANALGAQLGVDVELVPMSLDAMVPGLQSRKVDLALLTDSEERQKSLDFIDFLAFNQTFVSRADGDLRPESYDDLCGLSVGASRGSSTIAELDALSGSCAAKGGAGVKVDVYDSQAAAAIAVRSGRTDVYLTTSTNADQLIKEGDLAASGEINPSFAGFVSAKNRTDLRDAVFEAMQALAADGRLKEPFATYELDSTYMEPDINTATDAS